MALQLAFEDTGTGPPVVILHGQWARLVALEFSEGDLIIFVAMVCWALYTLGLTRVPGEINRLGLLAVQSAITLVALAPFLALEIASGTVGLLPAGVMAGHPVKGAGRRHPMVAHGPPRWRSRRVPCAARRAGPASTLAGIAAVLHGDAALQLHDQQHGGQGGGRQSGA